MLNELKRLIEQIRLNIESEVRLEGVCIASKSAMANYHRGRIYVYEEMATEINSIIRLNENKEQK